MKSIHYIYILSVIAALTACKDDIAPTYTVGEADNAIVLGAGISEGAGSAVTRAGAEEHHTDPGHNVFTASTKLRLRVDGTWTGKADGTAPHGTISSTTVSQSTTATIGDAITVNSETSATHNDVTFSTSEQLYWDDYGTADPNNIGTSESPKGRNKGLTIYGVAVDGVTTAVEIDGTTDGKKWTDLSWNVGTPSGTPSTLDQSGTDYWKNQDLLISNNVKDGGLDGTYKFDQRTQGKLLEFTHAMSKITVRLIASDGFPTTGVGATTAKFAAAPEVTLTSNETGQPNTEWANTACTVNVTDGSISNSGTPAVIKMHEADRTSTSYTVTFDALVAPGSEFKDKGSGTNDPYPVIARINADGNIYYVTAEKIRAAISAAITAGTHKNSYTTQPGVNYVITVNVKKTGIDVTATIKNWVDVEAETVEPVINVSTTIGGTSQKDDAFTSFDFYLSDDAVTQPSTAYAKKATVSGTKTDGSTAWTFDPVLYWPSHNTHYHMRGVYPKSTTVSEGKISVTAGDYSSTASPSNLMVGAPEFTDENKSCNNSDHTSVDMSQHGICAREANINLHFNYMMSQVEVRLTTTTDNDKVELENAKVEIINGYTSGKVDIHTKTVAVDGSIGDFEVKHISGENDKYRHSIVVPQALTNGSGESAKDLKFRITITNKDAVYYSASELVTIGDKTYVKNDKITGTGTTEDPYVAGEGATEATTSTIKIPATQDVYEATIKDIKVKEPGDSESKLITSWDSGKHYIYTLDMRKTNINVTATLTDWITVTASQPVWF